MKRIVVIFSVIFVLLSAFCVYLYYYQSTSSQALLMKPFISVDIQNTLRSPDNSFADEPSPSPDSPLPSDFIDDFTAKRTIEEAPNIGASSDANWWVNSGGQFVIEKGIGKTMQGDAPDSSRWYEAYKRTTPVDTDDGRHPQNIFRLVLRSDWRDYTQQVYAQVLKDNISNSQSRDDSNGLFLFNRYVNGDNVYYTGLRVDGAVVIKKKYKGAYYTMGYKKILNLPKYHRTDNPNLLPKDTWIGIKSTVTSLEDNKVKIDFYTDIGATGTWKLGISATDDNKAYGGPSLAKAGHAGIRTDFMDVQFKEYKISGI